MALALPRHEGRHEGTWISYCSEIDLMNSYMLHLIRASMLLPGKNAVVRHFKLYTRQRLHSFNQKRKIPVHSFDRSSREAPLQNPAKYSPLSDSLVGPGYSQSH